MKVNNKYRKNREGIYNLQCDICDCWIGQGKYNHRFTKNEKRLRAYAKILQEYGCDVNLKSSPQELYEAAWKLYYSLPAKEQ